MTNLADQFQDYVSGENTCVIWETECQDKRQDSTTITVLDSPRAGGSYVIDTNALPQIRELSTKLVGSASGRENFDRFRARLTTLLVRERQLGNELPKITESVVAAADSADPARMDERLTNLLRFLINSTPSAGQPVEIAYPDESQVTRGSENYKEAKRNLESALAHSESTNIQEMEYLADSLASQGLVDKGVKIRLGSTFYYSSIGFHCRVTASGYSVIQSLQTGNKSDQCFVALWFDEQTDALYDQAIEPAVEASGYKPLRIDRQPNFLGKIDDQIIAEIRRSKFVIADFTHDERGARGSVYYEAGFARGLDIPVIFTCRDDQIDDLHFDTNHFLHLTWSADAPEELIEPLKSRIEANIRMGPHATGEE